MEKKMEAEFSRAAGKILGMAEAIELRPAAYTALRAVILDSLGNLKRSILEAKDLECNKK